MKVSELIIKKKFDAHNDIEILVEDGTNNTIIGRFHDIKYAIAFIIALMSEW